MASTRKNRSGDKDTRAILRALEHAGFLIRYSRSGHPRIYKSGHLITTFPGTTSDYRSRRNSLAHLKRAGFVWPPIAARSLAPNPGKRKNMLEQNQNQNQNTDNR